MDSSDEEVDSSFPEVVARFGTPKAVYYYSRFWFGMALSLGAGAFLMGAGIIAVYWYFQANPPRQPLPGTALYWMSIGGLFLIVAPLIVVVGMMKNRQRCLIFAKALVKMAGNKASIWPWKEISEVYQHYLHPGLFLANKLWITRVDGEKTTIEGMRDQAALAEEIQNRVARHQLTSAIEAIDDGEAVTFGKLGVSQAGLLYKDSEVS
jgi:hypothetical protein